MADAKPTPGPWKIEMRGDPDDYDPDDEEGREWASAVDVSGPTSKDWAKFASVFTFVRGEPDPEGTANALLIASSPVLLAMLERAVELFEMDDECNEPGTDAWEWLQEARAALAAAKVNPTVGPASTE